MYCTCSAGTLACLFRHRPEFKQASADRSLTIGIPWRAVVIRKLSLDPHHARRGRTAESLMSPSVSGPATAIRHLRRVAECRHLLGESCRSFASSVGSSASRTRRSVPHRRYAGELETRSPFVRPAGRSSPTVLSGTHAFHADDCGSDWTLPAHRGVTGALAGGRDDGSPT